MSDKKDYQLDLLHRPRRLRQNQSLRDLVEETDLKVSKLIQPLFVIEGESIREPVASMPGLNAFSIDLLIKECESLIKLGIGGVALFPKIETSLKCNMGREALNPKSLIYRAIRALREHFPELTIIADLALDPYTVHGHDGIVEIGSQSPSNDVTVDILSEMAVLAAEAGATMVAPSDMMDGRVGVIRKTLDANAFESVLILSYAAKYASAFYGPFRDAVGSVSLEGGATIDKRSYQLNPANRREALLK